MKRYWGNLIQHQEKGVQLKRMPILVYPDTDRIQQLPNMMNGFKVTWAQLTTTFFQSTIS